jgi:BirA family biotin operon repressor/biotin-[acetyl-CoA-carboxylase] ligase
MARNPYSEIEHGDPGAIGWRIHYFDEVGSTQKVAAEMAEQGASQGTVVVAELQTAGRGRLGRSWHSPPNANLYATIILRPRMAIGEVARLTLVAGVGAAEAFETVAPGLVGLKWPNDVWLKGRKAGGIIAEAVTSERQELACVLLGIGLNLNLALHEVPEELRERATSVRIATGRRCDRIAVAATLFNRLNSRYMEAQESGFAAMKMAYERYFALAGKQVAVIDGAVRVAGRVVGIDDTGALMLETQAGTARVVAGEVSVEGAYD